MRFQVLNHYVPPKKTQKRYEDRWITDEYWKSPEVGSDIYDILTIFTFLFIESEKLSKKCL